MLRPVTTLDCFLLKDSSLVLAARLEPRDQFSSLSLSVGKKLRQRHALPSEPTRDLRQRHALASEPTRDLRQRHALASEPTRDFRQRRALASEPTRD